MHAEAEEFSKILMEWSCHHCCLYSKQVPYQEAEEQGSLRSMEWQMTINDSSEGVWLYFIQACSWFKKKEAWW